MKITDYHYNETGQLPTQGEGSGVLYPLNTLTGEINLHPYHHKSIHRKREMKAIQGISHSYSHLNSAFFFENFPDTGHVILFRFRVQEQTEYGQHQGSSGNFFISKVSSPTQGVYRFYLLFLVVFIKKTGLFR